jgi:hypothetical protein
MQRPRIYLAIILPLLLVGLVPVVAMQWFYARSLGMPLSAIPSPNGILIAVPTFILWIPLALMASNLILYAVPSLRSIAVTFAAEAGMPPLIEIQRRLALFALALAVICIPLVAWGFRT